MVTARAKFKYSPGDTVLVSNDSRSGSKGNKVIVKKLIPNSLPSRTTIGAFIDMFYHDYEYPITQRQH